VATYSQDSQVSITSAISSDWLEVDTQNLIIKGTPRQLI